MVDSYKYLHWRQRLEAVVTACSSLFHALENTSPSMIGSSIWKLSFSAIARCCESLKVSVLHVCGFSAVTLVLHAC